MKIKMIRRLQCFHVHYAVKNSRISRATKFMDESTTAIGLLDARTVEIYS